jgi:hypothetical protein
LLLTQAPSAICSTSKANTAHSSWRAAGGQFSARARSASCWVISSASSSMPPSRCSVTMLGFSFSVTVNMPNRPCTSTHTSVPVAHQGEIGKTRRQTQPASASTRISAPTVIAR